MARRYNGGNCCCPQPGCDFCSPSYSGTLQVTWTVAAAGGCSNCQDNDGTFAVPQIGALCQWKLLFAWPGFGCLPTSGGFAALNQQIDVTLTKPGSDYIVTVLIGLDRAAGQQVLTYQKNYGTTKPDCGAWSAENIPYVSSAGPVWCAGPLSTVTITSL